MKKVARLRLSDGQESSSMQAAQNNSDTLSVRTTGRKKKPKAVFDPSDNYLPRAQRYAVQSVSPTHSTVYASDNQARAKSPQLTSNTSSMSTSGESFDLCEICSKREAKRGAHARNKLIACLQCKKCVHKLCMLEEFSDFEKLRRFYKCEECRSCCVCQAQPIDKRRSIICTECVKVFHFECHSPPLQPAKFREPTVRRYWKCKPCMQSADDAQEDSTSDEEVIAKELPGKYAYTPSAGLLVQQQEKNETKGSATTLPYRKMSNGSNENLNKNKIPKMMENQNKNMVKKSTEINGTYNILEKIDLPNVQDWSVEQVTEYMSKYFPKEAYIFKEHEIDGASLLLMRRSDVVKKLSLNLGPSLRIYSLILKIQAKSNDPTLGWNCSK